MLIDLVSCVILYIILIDSTLVFLIKYIQFDPSRSIWHSVVEYSEWIIELCCFLRWWRRFYRDLAYIEIMLFDLVSLSYYHSRGHHFVELLCIVIVSQRIVRQCNAFVIPNGCVTDYDRMAVLRDTECWVALSFGKGNLVSSTLKCF